MGALEMLFAGCCAVCLVAIVGLLVYGHKRQVEN